MQNVMIKMNCKNDDLISQQLRYVTGALRHANAPKAAWYCLYEWK